ncbi:MAG: putative phosphothreonine lyase domain-containing protein [Methanoregulaceae archaeon]
MDEVDQNALADAAYGIFEHLLNNGLRSRGPYLFELVETSADFRSDFGEIFAEFTRDYPELAAALIARFGSPDRVYEMILAGEGVIPSKTTQMYWIIQDAPGVRPEATEDELAGKWLIFAEPDQADPLWKKIRDATVAGKLGISTKVSSAKPNPDSRDSRRVIYVYTPDWQDEAGIMKIREELRTLGVEERIGYKRNIETFRGEYSQRGKRVTYYSA